jgi:hypothetical protein
MSDAVDITMENIVTQYQDEVTKLIGEKLLLQAAVKILGDQKTDMAAQIRQLTEDLGTAVNDNSRLTDALEQVEQKHASVEAELEDMTLPVRSIPTTHHIPYTLGPSDGGE